MPWAVALRKFRSWSCPLSYFCWLENLTDLNILEGALNGVEIGQSIIQSHHNQHVIVIRPSIGCPIHFYQCMLRLNVFRWLDRVSTPEYWTRPGGIEFNFSGLSNAVDDLNDRLADYQWGLGSAAGLVDIIPIQSLESAASRYQPFNVASYVRNSYKICILLDSHCLQQTG